MTRIIIYVLYPGSAYLRFRLQSEALDHATLTGTVRR